MQPSKFTSINWSAEQMRAGRARHLRVMRTNPDRLLSLASPRRETLLRKLLKVVSLEPPRPWDNNHYLEWAIKSTVYPVNRNFQEEVSAKLWVHSSPLVTWTQIFLGDAPGWSTVSYKIHDRDTRVHRYVNVLHLFRSVPLHPDEDRDIPEREWEIIQRLIAAAEQTVGKSLQKLVVAV